MSLFSRIALRTAPPSLPVALVRAIVMMKVVLECMLLSRRIVVKFVAMFAEDFVIPEWSVGR
jgi:hypothetical protein